MPPVFQFNFYVPPDSTKNGDMDVTGFVMDVTVSEKMNFHL